VYNFHIFRLG